LSLHLDAMRFSFMCRPPRPPSRGRRVAIVGAGIAGLTVAGYLACRGVDVVVFERLEEAGGLLLHVIPELRVSHRRVLAGIEELENAMGVEIRRRVRVCGGEAPELEESGFERETIDLRDLVQEFDAVVIATGTWRTRRLGIPGEEAEGVYTALGFLFRMKRYRLEESTEPPPIQLAGRRVAVIGGDIMALDVAMEAIYEGAREVLLLYEGTARECPVGLYAIRSLETRGVRMVELVKPVEIIVEDGRARGLELVKLNPRTREPIEGSRFSIDVDVVINASSVEPTPPVEPGYLGIEVDEQGRIMVDENHRTGNPKVFACGDVVLGPSKLGYAVRDALYTARAVDEFLG